VVLLRFSPETALGGEVLTSRMAQFCLIEALSIAVAIALSEDSPPSGRLQRR